MAKKIATDGFVVDSVDRARFHDAYAFTLTGITPLLQHYDSPTFTDELTDYRKNDPAGKSGAKGDDRNPPWTWAGYLNVNSETGAVCIPQMNLTACLRDGGKKIAASSRRGSMKSASVTAFTIVESDLDIVLHDGRLVNIADVMAFHDEPFVAQIKMAEKLGIKLDVRRASLGTSKHVRVRPQFAAGWSIAGSLTVEDESLTHGALYDIFTAAGRLAGLGDWRPSAPKSPGPFGRFAVSDLSPL